MSDSYDLSKLDPNSFEHLVNALALKVLGPGHTGFGPGADGGRDGYFEGEAPYPSSTDRWSGRWYIQCKFHKPHLSKNEQKWLLKEISSEIKEFNKSGTTRVWPDNSIIATNIDTSGRPETGVFDKAQSLVKKARPNTFMNFHIWGGNKIIAFLKQFHEVSEQYSEFLTHGSILSKFYNSISYIRAEIDSIIRYFVVTQFSEQQNTKLEQAGASTDQRLGIHRLFMDLPFRSIYLYSTQVGLAAQQMARAAAQNHRLSQVMLESSKWHQWRLHPFRARTWFIKGGPGQGKSTLVQYLSQIQRSSLLLAPKAPKALPGLKIVAEELRETAEKERIWPTMPRVPVQLELKEYAQWYGFQKNGEPRAVITYLASKIAECLGETVLSGTLKRAFSAGRWFFIFDGLDEVPSDVKDQVASQVKYFIDDLLVECNCDAFSVCTSRPQGYSGQFSGLDAAPIELIHLSPDQALACAEPVLSFNRTSTEFQNDKDTLKQAISSAAVREMMTTPLQSHIMAVIVKNGGKPPERKWQLYTKFYQTIKTREANRKLPDKSLSVILREGDLLIKNLHNKLGFELHSEAEVSSGAQTSVSRLNFSEIIEESSRAGEFHPHALSEPYVSLSTHTAPSIRPFG